MGFQDFGDFTHPRHPAIRTTGLLTFALAGLSPAEHTSLHWSRPSDMLAVRNRAIDGRGLSPPRSGALLAATGLPPPILSPACLAHSVLGQARLTPTIRWKNGLKPDAGSNAWPPRAYGASVMEIAREIDRHDERRRNPFNCGHRISMVRWLRPIAPRCPLMYTQIEGAGCLPGA